MINSTADLLFIFDFHYNPYVLFSLWAVLISSVLLYLIVSKGIQVSANRWFAFVLITIILWGLFEALNRFSATAVSSDFWNVSAMIGWAFVAPAFLGFTLTYIGNDKFLTSIGRQLLVFGPAFVFLFLGWTTGLINNRNIEQFQRVFYGWESPSASFFWLVIAWIDGLFIIALFLLNRHWIKVKDAVKKRQTSLFIVAVLIPIVGGSITNGIMPILGVTVFPAAILLTSVMSLIVTYAILKYKLFVINPATVVSSIVDTMHEMLIVFNPNHVIEFVNPAVEAVLGYGQEKLVGEPLSKLFESSWEDVREKYLEPVYEGKTVSGIDLNLVSASGEKIPVSFSASALKDPKGTTFGIVGVATDISKIRDLFSDVTAERNKLTTTIESIADGVIALDFAGTVIMTNPAALKMLSLSEGDVVGKNLDTVVTMTEGDRRIKFKDLITKRKLTKDTVIAQKENIKLNTNFGKEAYVNLTSSAIKEGSEAGLGAIVTLNDISKEKELEEMKIDFVSMAAHELRTPLTAIRGYLSVLQEEITANLSKEQNSFLDKAFISSSQLAALVENLLSVSRIERGAMKLEAEPQDWKGILNEVVANYTPLAKEKEIRLVLNALSDLPKVLVDKFRISEVLSNLIGNALNYTNAGGSVELSSEFDKKNNLVITRVKDTGQGIPESALPHLFTKFFRVSGVLEQGSKGTGLGLYISKAIIEMHHGEIWVESLVGKGSTFSFSVPIVAESIPVKPKTEGAKPNRVFVRKARAESKVLA